MVDASSSPRYAGLVGKRDFTLSGFSLYWDSRTNHSFISGGDMHISGVKKLMTIEGSVEVKIEEVVFEVFKEGKDQYEVPRIVVSFKNPTNDSEARGRVEPSYLKHASKLFKDEVFPREIAK